MSNPVQSYGLISLSAAGAPSWTPSADDAIWAVEPDSLRVWYYNRTTTTWVGPLDLQAAASITVDGNTHIVTRGNATADVAPTGGEVASPINGDTARVYLTDGTIEWWVYSTSWSKASTVNVRDVTNLSVTANPTNVTIGNSNGDGAVLPLATGTNAGLLSPAEKGTIAASVVAQLTYTSMAEASSILGQGKLFAWAPNNTAGATAYSVARTT